MDNTDINTATLTDADVQAFKDAIAAAVATIPFMQNLTAAQRKGLLKTGPERVAFVENGLQAAQNNPVILPGTFDTANYASRMDLFRTVTELNTIAAQFASKMDDTHMKVGGLLMDKASDVKKYVDTAAKKTPGLKPVADQLGALYQKAVATRRANAKKKAGLAASK